MATTLGRGPQTVKGCEGIAQRPVVDIDKDPRESITTLAVLFAVAAGYRWGTPKPYLDIVEEMPGGRIERRVYWIFDGDSTVEIEGQTHTFGEFWDRLHDCARNPGATAIYQLAFGLPILARTATGKRADALRYWSGCEVLSDPAKAIFAEAATIYDQFLADRLPRFILVQQARGSQTVRAYIPLHATPEERADILRRAGIS